MVGDSRESQPVPMEAEQTRRAAPPHPRDHLDDIMVVWLDFDPQAGHEQRGRRPAVVISNVVANRVLHTRAFVCPITRTDRDYPFQPRLDGRTETTGVVLCDQVRVVDLVAWRAEFVETMPEDVLREAVDIVYGFIEPTDEEGNPV